MIELKKRIRDILIADAEVTNLLGGPSIYLALGPSLLQRPDYPLITLRDNDGGTYKHLNVYNATLWVDIWVNGSGSQTKAGLIAQRINRVLNRKPLFDDPSRDEGSFRIWRLEKISSPELWEQAEQIFHKAIQYSVIVDGD